MAAVAAAIAVVAVVAVAATAVLVWAPWRTEPSPPSPTGALVLIDPASNAVTARTAGAGLPVGGRERTRRGLDGRFPGRRALAV